MDGAGEAQLALTALLWQEQKVAEGRAGLRLMGRRGCCFFLVLLEGTPKKHQKPNC